MDIRDIGDPIANRKLTIGNEDVFVTIGKPKPFDNEGDYYCPYSIECGGQKKVSYAGGMDSVQALQLAMKKIGADLTYLAKTKGIPISWLADTPGEIGFPE